MMLDCLALIIGPEYVRQQFAGAEPVLNGVLTTSSRKGRAVRLRTRTAVFFRRLADRLEPVDGIGGADA
jgi:hypothetical protein